MGKTANGNMTKANDGNGKALFCTGMCEESMTEKHFRNYFIRDRVIFFFFLFCVGKACKLLKQYFTTYLIL